MADWEHFVKPLGFIVLYVVFAAAVRAVLKPFFPNGANWIFILLLLAGLALMYYVYYEAFYLVKEILWPSWFEGQDGEDADPLGGMLAPTLFGLAVIFLIGSYFSFSRDPAGEYYLPLGVGLFFLSGGVLATYSDDLLEQE